jgi:D-threo-aldose 1-dehydrogenase
MELNKRRLGRTGLQVTEMGLGGYQFTAEFGVPYDEAEKILDFALTQGINYVDTAQMYGFGESEAAIGRALRRHKGPRVHVSDKVGYVDRGVTRAAGLAAYQDPAALKRMIKHSFWLLQLDYVDVFMIHEPNESNWWHLDFDTGDAVVTAVLEELKKEGVIGAIGLGCWDSEILARLCNTGRFDVALNAGGINLFDRPMFRSLVTAAQKHDVGVVVGGVLGQGFAAELLSVDRERVTALLQSGEENKRVRGRKLAKLYDISEGAGIPMLDLSMRYVQSFPEIHCHIPGARLADHVRQNIAAYQKGPLPRDVVEAIIKISQGEEK